MDLALYAPGLGYYSAGARKLGRAGTSSRRPRSRGCSAAAWRCSAPRCCAARRRIDPGDRRGNRPLAADVLLAARCARGLPARYLILEVSADLRERQREALRTRAPHSAGARRVAGWRRPSRALRRHRARQRGARRAAGGALSLERGALRGTGRRVAHRAASSGQRGPRAAMRMRRARRSRRRPADGTTATCRSTVRGSRSGRRRSRERSQRRGPVDRLRTAARSILFSGAARRHVALSFPAARPRRSVSLSGTLGHHGVGGLHAPRGGGRPAGFSSRASRPRANFLAGLDIDREMRISPATRRRFARLASEARRLLLPGEMGERFKAMAWLARSERAAARLRAQGSAAHPCSRERRSRPGQLLELGTVRAPRRWPARAGGAGCSAICGPERQRYRRQLGLIDAAASRAASR